MTNNSIVRKGVINTEASVLSAFKLIEERGKLLSTIEQFHNNVGKSPRIVSTLSYALPTQSIIFIPDWTIKIIQDALYVRVEVINQELRNKYGLEDSK